MGKLFLIPGFLGPAQKTKIPRAHIPHIKKIRHFIVESEKTARLFLKTIEHPVAMGDFTFYLLNEHTPEDEDMTPWFQCIFEGKDLGLLSDAGLPCVADPGSRAVAYAHTHGIPVVPLSGPSSIFMALMGSGFNGQQFTFHGYLPIDLQKRARFIKDIEDAVYKTGYTQIFIETPYRNKALLELLLLTLKPRTGLCIACGLENQGSIIMTKAVRDWKTEDVEIHKRPAVFLLG